MITRRLYGIKRRKRWILMKKLLTGFTAFFIILCLSVSLGFNFASAGTENEQIDKASGHKYYKSIELKSGDTLWTIAQRYMDECYDSTEDYVEELISINRLSSDQIYEGEFLMISYYRQ